MKTPITCEERSEIQKFFKKIFKLPGLTKTSYHTISIYEKLLVIQFHTIPYVQKIV